MPEISGTLKGSFTKLFGTVRPKLSTENRDVPSCPYFFFRYQKSSRKKKGSSTKLFGSVLLDKKFRQNRDAHHSYA